MPVFVDFVSASEAARELHAMSPALWDLLAWVIMPDHVHVLAALDGTTLSDCMRRFKGRTSRFLGNGRGLWQRGFYDHTLRREEDVVDVARYVVANPLRAGLVRRLGDYPYWDCV
ncbi:MAG: transposase [Burkholderiales bacterium]